MAETYDAIDDQPFYAVQYATYREDLRARAAAWRGGTVLDLGCGTGIHTLALAAIAARVVGVDVSPALVRKARAKLLHATNALVVVADATALPFRATAFDGATSYGEPLSHMADPGAALGELARVVRAGARVALSVDNAWNLRTLLHPRQLAAAIGSRGGAVRTWEYFDDDGRRVRLELKTFTHRELAAMLVRHGFALEDAVGVHVFTLLVPLATHARGHGVRGRAVGWLHRLDRRLAGRAPWNRFGSSKIVGAVRR